MLSTRKENRLPKPLKRQHGAAEAGNPSDYFLEAHRSHAVECEVQRALLSDPELKISSLVIHRIPDGVCLEGTIEVDDQVNSEEHINSVIGSVAGINRILNHLVTRSGCHQLVHEEKQ